ncbi:MAG TPA: peptide chain release factor 3 [Pirellulaceae bacterium]|nr:peptide chain release factor 3 [Pirellulaceae bacterium]
MAEHDLQVVAETLRRRTFAIISHPDAGKTTLTEKLLLFGGCIEVAGAVRGRRTQRGATSDWLELEKQRGISVSSTVLTFEYEGHLVNLLDTPGHQDFSEDTYRTLMAADCAVMVIDVAKGIETQTEKLFRVCALRRIPVITFVNKVDRPGRGPLEVLAEIEHKFGITAIPMNWPIGMGADLAGVVSVETRKAYLFERQRGDRRIEAVEIDLERIVGHPDVDDDVAATTLDEFEVLEAAGTFDPQRFLAGEISPVFFGSALTNFGVEQFLRGFLRLAPPPHDREADIGPIDSMRSEFAGFVFKIQANLDPKHRDRIAFVRICAGRFRRDMEVLQSRTGKKIRLRRAHRVFGQERETMDEAYPGDIIGLVNPGEFRLGDTICEGKAINFSPLPQFSPENFAILRCKDTQRRKQFQRGMQQLLEEGAIQVFSDPQGIRQEPILAAVGELQFDVVRFRLESEYDTPTSMEVLPYSLARWIEDDPELIQKLRLPYSAAMVRDRAGGPAILFHSKWDLESTEKNNPNVRFSVVSLNNILIDE